MDFNRIKKIEMKKYFKILFITMLTLQMFSCTDLIEEPVGIFDPSGFFKSGQDVQTMINGAYGLLAQEPVYGRKIQMTLMLASDMCDIGDASTAARRIEVNSFSLDANNGMTNALWPQFYRAISTVNSAIKGAEMVDIPEKRRNELIGEAKTIRALVYYHMVQLFGDVPLITEPVSDISKVESMVRTPEADVWAQIIEDCKFGLEHMKPYHEEGRSRATAAGAATLLSSTYLTLGDWTNAAKYAEELINNEQKYGVSLTPNYIDLFDAAKADTDEAIWVADFKADISSYPLQVDYFPTITGVHGGDDEGWSVMVPSPGVYESFDPNDYRTKHNFTTEQYIKGELKPYTEFNFPRIHIGKWRPGAVGSHPAGLLTDHNYFHFRYAEVLLIAAEALNELNGPSAKTYEYINRVRARARFNGTDVSEIPVDVESGLSQDEFRSAVREERRIELAFEWKRWYDMRRWDNGDITEYFNKENSYESQELVKKTHKLFPIPQSERELNSNLAQNPGY